MDLLFGLPAHPFLVHLTVVAIPVAAILGVVALFPRVPQLVKITTLVLGGLSVVLVPLMESSGEALEKRVGESAAVERHAHLGETLLPWVIGLFVMSVAVFAVDRWFRSSGSGRPSYMSAAKMVCAALVLVAAAGTLVQIVRIGHSGAEATWSTPAGSVPSEQDDR